MKIKNGIFPKIVVNEAKSLKKFATKEELSKLNFTYLDPNRADQCIYGQCFGRCDDERAVEAIETGCPRVYEINKAPEMDNPQGTVKLNGSPKKNKREYMSYAYWSPIEVFIAKAPPEMNKNLLSFLKEKEDHYL